MYRYPEEMYRHTEEVYRQTEEVYRHTEEVYRQTEEVYRHTEEVYRQTEEMYRYPEEVYRHPEEVYRHTEEVYRQTEEVYRQTEEVYRHPEEVYRHTEEVYRQTEEVYRHTEEDLWCYIRAPRANPGDTPTAQGILVHVVGPLCCSVSHRVSVRPWCDREAWTGANTTDVSLSWSASPLETQSQPLWRETKPSSYGAAGSDRVSDSIYSDIIITGMK
ncbi:hypothetical protein NFI96_009549 [Prochilodus magdalenae]|nr:hypothetical protein NFI96_009549 [Prochilodus magdalenae]